MKNKLSISLLIMFSTFLVLTILVQSGIFLSLDKSITLGVQKIIPRIFDLPLSLFSLIGTVELASLIFLMLLFFSKGLNKLLILSLYVMTGVIELIGKSVIVQNAPPISLLRTYQFFEVPSGGISAHFFSYPSGHSARTAFISGLILYMIWENNKLGKELKYILSAGVIIFDFLMLGSRVYLGEHWITDVIGGAMLGFFLFILGVGLSRRLNI